MQSSGKYHHRKFEIEPFLLLENIFKKFQNNYGIESSNDSITTKVQNQIIKHIEGVIVGPTVVALGMNKMFHKYFFLI